MPTGTLRTPQRMEDVISSGRMDVKHEVSPSKKRKVPPSSPPPATLSDDDDYASEEEEEEEGSPSPQHSLPLHTQVINLLTLPSRPVNVAQEYSSSRFDVNPIKAFAKLEGPGWMYLFLTIEVIIGRGSPEDNAEEKVDVDLGPGKVVSRTHAKIKYHDGFDGAKGQWAVYIIGRNGIKVNEQGWKAGQSTMLENGDILEIGGVQMMFCTPDPVPVPKLEEQYQRLTGTLPPTPSDTRPSLTPTLSPQSPHTRSRQTQSSPIKKFRSYSPSSPYANGPRVGPTVSKSSPSDPRGTQHHQSISRGDLKDIDLSADSSRDVKPSYSYAMMIAQAILSQPERKCQLSKIYEFIQDKYAYYRGTKAGWQNSIRHNLSLNKAFIKVPRRTDEPGKGMKWQIAEEYLDEYLAKVNRTMGGNTAQANLKGVGSMEGADYPPRRKGRSSNHVMKSEIVSDSDVENGLLSLKEIRGVTPIRSPEKMGLGYASTPNGHVLVTPGSSQGSAPTATPRSKHPHPSIPQSPQVSVPRSMIGHTSSGGTIQPPLHHTPDRGIGGPYGGGWGATSYQGSTPRLLITRSAPATIAPKYRQQDFSDTPTPAPNRVRGIAMAEAQPGNQPLFSHSEQAGEDDRAAAEGLMVFASPRKESAPKLVPQMGKLGAPIFLGRGGIPPGPVPYKSPNATVHEGGGQGKEVGIRDGNETLDDLQGVDLLKGFDKIGGGLNSPVKAPTAVGEESFISDSVGTSTAERNGNDRVKLERY